MAACIFDKTFVFLLVNILLFEMILARDFKKDGFEYGDAYSGMWFGPRLGKRAMSLSRENDRGLYRMLEEADALKYFYNQMPYYDEADDPNTRAVTKKVIFTPKLGRSADEENFRKIDVNFTPRLGRRLPEKVGVTLSDTDIMNEEPQPMNGGQKNRYFSPRLGRNMNFSPRLGRDLLYEVMPDNIRVARSVNKKNTNTTKKLN